MSEVATQGQRDTRTRETECGAQEPRLRRAAATGGRDTEVMDRGTCAGRIAGTV